MPSSWSRPAASPRGALTRAPSPSDVALTYLTAARARRRDCRPRGDGRLGRESASRSPGEGVRRRRRAHHRPAHREHRSGWRDGDREGDRYTPGRTGRRRDADFSATTADGPSPTRSAPSRPRPRSARRYIGDVTFPAGGDAVPLLPARYEVAAALADILAGSATVDIAPGVPGRPPPSRASSPPTRPPCRPGAARRLRADLRHAGDERAAKTAG